MSLEQGLGGQQAADRVRMLGLLKRGTAKSLKDCAPLVGYSAIQLTRWWERYRHAGMAELLKQHRPSGMASRMTAEAWAGLMGAMRKGAIVPMEDARAYVEREWAIRSKNRKSLWWRFKKHRLLVEDWAAATQNSQCRAAGGL